MAVYPVKMIKDENGQPFVPITGANAIVYDDAETLQQKLDKKLEKDNIIAGANITLSKSGNNITINSGATGVLIDNLTTTTAGQGALDARQGSVLKNLIDTIPRTPVIDDVTSTSTTSALSANQGYLLNNKFNNYLLKSGGTLTGTLQLGNSTQSSVDAIGLRIHDLRNLDVAPNTFGDRSANLYFHQINGNWYSILHMKGWSGDYQAWELAGPAHSSSGLNTLYYRAGTQSNTWQEWKTIAFTDSNVASATKATQDGNGANIASTYLKLSGGTVTGTITANKAIQRTGGAYSWNTIRTNNDTAFISCTSYSGYQPMIKQKTPSGVWGLGCYSSSVHLTYFTDASTDNNPLNLLELGYDGNKLVSGGVNVPHVWVQSGTPTAKQTGDIWFVT